MTPAFDADWLARGVAGRVSVIMPCYNLEAYLDNAVASVLAQGVDCEIMLADDGSKDSTRDIIARLAAGHANIHALYAAKNQGPFALRNWAMRECSGEYIAFLDGDDYWAAGKLTAQLEAFAVRPDAGLAHHYLMRVDEEGRPHRRLQLESERYDGESFLPMLTNNGVATSATLLRRATLAKVGGFDERFRYRGDWEMWTRIARHFPFAFIARDLGYYRIHADNISSKTDKIRPYAFAILDKFATEYGLTAAQVRDHIEPCRTALHKGYGMMSLVGRDLPAARRDLWAAFRRAPDRATAIGLIKAYAYGLTG